MAPKLLFLKARFESFKQERARTKKFQDKLKLTRKTAFEKESVKQIQLQGKMAARQQFKPLKFKPTKTRPVLFY